MCKQLWIISMKNFMTLCLMHPNCLVPSIIQLKKIHISICGSSGWKSWHQNSSYWKLNSRDANKGELLEFVKKKKHECENKSLFEAWRCCGSMNGWFVNWSQLMQLWKKVLVILRNIFICENGFPNKMQSKVTCELLWNWMLWMLWWKSHYATLRWTTWTRG